MQQFDRVYKMTVGNDAESVVIEKLRIAFEIIKTIDAEPNQATFSIYNLSPSHRSLIAEKKFDRMKFEAGYKEGGLRTLFLGWIDQAENFIEGADSVTGLIASDGSKDYREAVVNKTIAKGSTKKEVINSIVGDMPNTDNAGVVDIPDEEKLIRGRVLFGSCRSFLDRAATDQGARWSIQDNEFMFLPNDKALSNTEGFVLSKETGMIGSPAKNSDGLEVRCYLNNIMQIGQLTRIQTEIPEYNGDYKIMKLTMSGDTHSNDWYNALIIENGQYKPVEGGAK